MEEREKIYLEILRRLQGVCDSLNIDMWLCGYAALSAFRDGRLPDAGVDVLAEAKDAVRLAEALAAASDGTFGCESMLSNDRYPRFEIRVFDPRTTDCDTSEFFKIDNNCMHVAVRFLQDPTDSKSLRSRIAKKFFKSVSGAASYYKQQAAKPVTGSKLSAAGTSFDRKIFSAKQAVDICGSTFYIPRDAEAFFEAQYGPGWEYLEIPAFKESDTHFTSTEKSWEEWRSGMSDEDISSYERLLKDYRKENAENRKLGKKVDHVYDVSACCCDKIRLYKQYARREEELADFLSSGDYGRLESELMPYLKGLKKYMDLGLDLYVDDKLTEIADSLLRALGHAAFADGLQKLVPADRQPVKLTDHHGEHIEYEEHDVADASGKLSPAQQSLLELMKRVDVFLRENDIEYFLFGGSLLGAIRHDGFIPWDDDMDIVMTTENYHRLIDISDNLPWDDISFDCFEKDPAFQRPFGMFNLLTDTRFVKTRVFNGGLGMGTGIDVFPMDNVPEEALDEYLKNSLLYQEIQSDSFINNAKIAEISSEYFDCKERERQTGKTAETQRLLGELEKYSPVKDDDLRVVRLWFRRPRIYKPGMMADPVMHKFEDTEFPVPARAVECLEMQYGSTWNVIPEDADRGEHAFMVDREVSANNYYRLIDSYVDWEQMADVLSKRKQERIRLLSKKQELDGYRKSFASAGK